MLKLRLYMLLFCLALSIPTGYLVRHTYRSVHQEEIAELRYFAGSLFDRMEEELSRLIRREEARAIDAYTHPMEGASGTAPSPLSRPSDRPPISMP